MARAGRALAALWVALVAGPVGGDGAPPAERRPSGPELVGEKISGKAVWRALDALGTGELEAPRLLAAYRALVSSGVLFNRNPYASHAPPRDRIDLYVTRLADVEKRAYGLRRALYLPPPATLRFRVKVPAGAKLALGMARAGGAAALRVRADDAVLLERALPPLGWAEATVDLAAVAGREVTLSFETSGSGHAFLADPRVIAREPAAPNVLVLFIDTLATWAVGCYGQKRPVTPTLDRLCAEGTVFENAAANANWTRPSTVSMLSSWLPGKIGISYNQFFGLDIAPERSAFYARKPDLLPLLARQGGYRTAAFVNNLFLQGYHRYGVDVGFDEVLDYRRHVEDTVDISDAAIRFLEANKDDRFFLFLNYNAPHVKYVPPEKYAAQVRRMAPARSAQTAAYLGEVRYTDAEVRRVLDALDRLGLRENTLVVLSADHGEVHDPRHAYRVARTGRYSRFGHAVTMYDEEVKVPMVLRQPGAIPAGQRVAAQVRLLDLAPTLLEALGLPASPKHQGKSFLGLARGAREEEERVAFIEGRMMRAVRAGGFKYFWRLPGYEAISRTTGTAKVAEELYDLTKDPAEHVNLAGDPAQHARLEGLRTLGRRIQATDAVATRVAPGATAGTAASAASAGAGARARVYLRFVGDGRLARYQGRLRALGGVEHFRLVNPKDGDAVWRDEDGTLRLRVEVRKGPRTLWAEVASAAPLRLELEEQGAEKVPLRVGPFGLPLLELGEIAGDDLALLDAAHAPPLAPGHERGVFLWRRPGSAAASAAPAAGAPSAEADERSAGHGGAEREVEKMLQDWGYIQGGRRKPH